MGGWGVYHLQIGIEEGLGILQVSSLVKSVGGFACYLPSSSRF